MSPRQAHEGPPGEVLVVDDTAESLAYLCELLGRQGYAVRSAPDGELALWTVRNSPPDLVLLDVRMPAMDGFEVCRRLKADERTAGIPVIFLSAHVERHDKARAFRSGAVDFIGKPLAGEEVLQRVATHIALARATKALAREKRTLEERVRTRTEALERTVAALRGEIASRVAAEKRLRLIASAFEVSLSPMFITDAEGGILAVNPAFSAAMGYPPAACVGQDIRLIIDAARHDEGFFRLLRETVQAEGRWTGELWCRRQDGNQFPCLAALVAVRDEDESLVNHVGVFHDLSESRDAQTLIEFLTHHDPLTGLPNRILVRDRFRCIEDDAQPGETVAVICVNLNRFRDINDFFGYGAGNQVLQWVAGQIGDCVPPRDTVFREAGDEFVLIHRDDGGLAGVQSVIDAIQSRLNTDMSCDELTTPLSVSVGVALYPDDGATLDALIASAALAMARAKAQGGRDPVFFSAGLDHAARQRFDLARRLRHGVARGEFALWYQPQVDAASGRIVAAEALLRWHPADLGFVSPARFIPIAEETGCIIDIGAWVLHTACAQIAAWRAAGCGPRRVAVNLSARQLVRPDLCATVARAMQESGIPPDSLELEITESSLMDDVPRTIATLRELHGMGVSLSLDDFGTGYSSLSYLKRFPIDHLKIDQSFVSALFEEPDAEAIVRAIIGLAHNMRMDVIAEGVETDAQRRFLAAQGCDLLQGYLLGKPLPADAFPHAHGHAPR
ncbi:MAG: EAL domain-containing protein [Rhodocyclaceae bacterium]|nr:EAL domain-containing protein [Rhodocyclaceae bacterium]